MSAKIIPFRIIVNPVLHSELTITANDNADMDYQEKTPQGRELARLARGKTQFNGCFRANGQLNIRALAAKLSELSGETIHQSTLHRLAAGTLSGKPATLAPIAAAFGMSVPDFWAAMNPEASKPAASAMPPAAADLWSDWERVPKPIQDLLRQQIKAYAENAELHPELTAMASDQAKEMSERIRAQRIKTKRATRQYPR